MGAALVISARETLEASLLIGIFVAYLTQTNNRHHLPKVWGGIALAAIASALVGGALILILGELTEAWS